ncbi:GAF domain-containing protein [Tardiphaga alba]|uniref:GAF domain-containing protein n=1 Tax=Tardiphaga alba TaxID=340268 RepID=A0ABX8AHF8_9BRAD|nr:GAF domain-containing DNA-binding protein [Tardiphaga alba]QUS41823.1 GAF domain-containing protein [Tardiphaga alba]
MTLSLDPTPPLTPPWEFVSRDSRRAGSSGRWVFDTALALLTQPLDAAIGESLQMIGTSAGADRAWMFEYDADHLRFRNTYEWSRGGAGSFVQDLQNVPVAIIAWLHQHLVAGQAVMINDIDALPRSAGPLRAEFLRQGNKSVLSVPMFHDGRLVACIGFDAVEMPRRWSGEIADLFSCADLIAAARYGRPQVDVVAGEASSTPDAMIYLRRANGVRGTPLSEIVGLRSSKDYTEVWLVDGTMALDLRTLTQWLGLLPAGGFVRVHRTAVVNHQFVRDVERRESGAWQLRVHELKEHWPVSRSGRAELRARLGI